MRMNPSAALQNLKNTGCGKLYLTRFGDGGLRKQPGMEFVFYSRSLKIFPGSALNVKIVSYGHRARGGELIEQHNATWEGHAEI